MKNKPTVTVGIPAFNEEKTILSIVKDVLRQKQTLFVLKEINIYSDGSTDNTVVEAQKATRLSKLIKVYSDTQRRGKYYRLNQMFKRCSSDILITTDADLTWVGDNFINDLVKVFNSDKKALLVSANPIPLRTKDFVGKLIHTAFALWDNVRLSIPNQDHVQNFYACGMAFKGGYAQKIKIPEGVNEMRMYLYALTKKDDGFRYLVDAKLLYWPPTTMYDYLKLANRTFGTRNEILINIFGEKIMNMYTVPRKYVIIGIIKTFFQYPFFTPLALILNFYVTYFRPKPKIHNTPLWEISKSTKKIYSDKNVGNYKK